MRNLVSSFVMCLSLVLAMSACGKSEVQCDAPNVVAEVIKLYKPSAMVQAEDYFWKNDPEVQRIFNESMAGRKFAASVAEQEAKNKQDMAWDKAKKSRVTSLMQSLNFKMTLIRTDKYDPQIKKKECRAKLMFNDDIGKDISYTAQLTSSGETMVEVDLR